VEAKEEALLCGAFAKPSSRLEPETLAVEDDARKCFGAWPLDVEPR
jgi:hypothetical protein